MMNVLNGGVHADNNVDFQEFMIMPVVEFFVNVLSTPAILVGLVALLGLALQGKPVEDLIRGTLKTIVGQLLTPKCLFLMPNKL